MAFQTTFLASDAFTSLRSQMPSYKSQAQSALTWIQGHSIDTNYIYTMLDQLRGIVASINNLVPVSGLAAEATARGYTGNIVTDANAVASAATNCISWVTTNFPKDAQGFVQDFTLNADGTRTAASFTSAQTAGLQTALSSLVATIQ